MSFWKRAKASVAISRKAEEMLYERAYDEFESGDIRRGLWAQALSEASGNESQAKGIYLRLRVRSMVDDGAIIDSLTQPDCKDSSEDIEATTGDSSVGQSGGWIAAIACACVAVIVSGYYWYRSAAEPEAAANRAAMAPACKSGDHQCAPWERDWRDRHLQVGDVITPDGFIIGCTIYWDGQQFVRRKEANGSNASLRFTASGVGVSVEFPPDVAARLKALPDSEYQHYFGRSIWPAARKLCNGIHVATPLPLP